jgi:hypothetical protein
LEKAVEFEETNGNPFPPMSPVQKAISSLYRTERRGVDKKAGYVPPKPANYSAPPPVCPPRPPAQRVEVTVKSDDTRRQVLKECADMCYEMAMRYDDDIEGCTAEELIRYSEGMSCALRLADIFKKDEMHKWLDGGEVVK